MVTAAAAPLRGRGEVNLLGRRGQVDLVAKRHRGQVLDLILRFRVVVVVAMHSNKVQTVNITLLDPNTMSP